MKIITKNRKAFHDYDVIERIEAGVVLSGEEVKSIRAGNVNLMGAFGHIKDGELFLVNAYVAPYTHAYSKDEEQARKTRKLLVHRRELNNLIGEVAKKGITLIPLSIYITGRGNIKVELGLCKHKKAIGKKRELKERDIKRETQREIKNR